MGEGERKQATLTHLLISFTSHALCKINQDEEKGVGIQRCLPALMSVFLSNVDNRVLIIFCSLSVVRRFLHTGSHWSLVSRALSCLACLVWSCLIEAFSFSSLIHPLGSHNSKYKILSLAPIELKCPILANRNFKK